MEKINSMKILDEIKKSDKKPKELNAFIAKLILEKKPSADDFTEALSYGDDAERGTCIEALEYATQTNAGIAKIYLSDVIKCLSDKSPRVKWEASRVIGNIAKALPKETEKALDALFKNTTDKGTVVRWSTAFALGEILKHNQTIRTTLLSKINAIVKKEENNGVKNVYVKALRVIGK